MASPVEASAGNDLITLIRQSFWPSLQAYASRAVLQTNGQDDVHQGRRLAELLRLVSQRAMVVPEVRSLDDGIQTVILFPEEVEVELLACSPDVDVVDWHGHVHEIRLEFSVTD